MGSCSTCRRTPTRTLSEAEADESVANAELREILLIQGFRQRESICIEGNHMFIPPVRCHLS